MLHVLQLHLTMAPLVNWASPLQLPVLPLCPAPAALLLEPEQPKAYEAQQVPFAKQVPDGWG
ncbi:hypothetical protein D3C74_453790 [compost metagenome]